ncbi:pentapeptide repeat-containing protein [Micromonospora lupini]|uniref:pentapeptide repeat-containing protein n=1 Tax=Micromonospora lupini TaxID=285679 RepID=UPI002252EEC2|nr:pentapeptide repeat-containing protein [Micromonospora lupini]MCX5069500.1 pentapeptide repeat-containing protein [Micromonospora lupini]
MPELTEDTTFRHEDWYAEELTDRQFVACEFFDVDLTEAVTRGAVFTGCTFGNVQFNASRHLDSAFTRCVFRRCNFFEAEFTGCKLVGSTFVQCELRPLRVDGGDWSFVALPGADLRAVWLSGVRMREADLTGANLTGATVTGVDLSGAQLHNCRLGGADLRRSDLTALDPTSVERAGALVDVEQALVIAQALGFRIG